MGGGVSLVASVEDLVTTTYLIGRAISAISFPGMYRIYDFHSKRAPRLKNAQKFTFFVPDSDDEEEEDDYIPPDPSEYEHFFKVRVGEDDIYLEDVLEENEAGWTPLHSCCMSINTETAGIAIVDEVIRLGGSLEVKTRVGPGTFNRSWTPLHMCSAYGMERLVEKLVDAGADVNTVNCFGYSPLLEACHRGFLEIVKHLIKGGADFSYIPKEEDAQKSPFAGAPCQHALAESARCGFFRVVKCLLDAGAPKDMSNKLGWTALHEACFYNRVETVKTLLLAGANPELRTRLGALPYHLAGLQEIKVMLESMGGRGAVPNEGDVIDMVQILTELTMPEMSILESRSIDAGSTRMESESQLHAKSFDSVHFSARHNFKDDSKHLDEGYQNRGEIKANGAKQEEQLIHSGGILGNLPALGNRSSPGKGIQTDLESALSMTANNRPGALLGTSPSHAREPSRKADDKKKKKKKVHDAVPPDMPKAYLCQLTQRPMSEPVKTAYGNIYDKSAISSWFESQGKICPLTGAPLSEVDLTPMSELGDEIRKWILDRSTNGKVSSVAGTPSSPKDAIVKKKETTPAVNDDLYEF